MKLANDVLLEIVDILRRGLEEARDISQELRDLDLTANNDETLSLSKKYMSSKGRVYENK